MDTYRPITNEELVAGLKAEARVYPTETLPVDVQTLPGGEVWLSTPMEDGSFTEFRALPNVLYFGGDRYHKSSWNSDRMRAYYGPAAVVPQRYAEVGR